ncbi:MAG TPA: hypothetical protein PK156_22910 [Polyangium sp.]|nr:hypothetical protein [Polyangium sp.]
MRGKYLDIATSSRRGRLRIIQPRLDFIEFRGRTSSKSFTSGANGEDHVISEGPAGLVEYAAA